MLGMLIPPFEFRISTGPLNTHPNPNAPLPNDVMSHFLRFDNNNYYLGQQPEAHAFDPNYPHVRTVHAGTDGNKVNNFVWLPYLPGFITYVPFERTLPILTGKMSGCWLCLFMMNGRTFLCHIGTHDFDLGLTERVKNCWKMTVSHKRISPYKAVRPDTYGEAQTGMFAGLSEKGTFFSLGCSAPRTGDYKVENRSQIGSSPSAPIFL